MTFSDPHSAPFSAPGAGPSPGPPAPPIRTGAFSLLVLLDNVDITSRISGRMVIEAEETSARIARFTYSPPAGAIDILDWLAKKVVIEFIDADSVNTVLFTGKVSWPDYDPQRRLVDFMCSDGLQEYFETKSESQILAEIPGGLYDSDVFGERRDGWSQAEDVISTVAASVDLLADGVTLANTPWYSGAVSYAFSASNCFDVDIEIARLRDITNQTVIQAQYKTSREHHREHDFYWQWEGLCPFLDNAHELPTRDMWNTAASQLNWKNMSGSVCFKTLPPDGFYCNDQGLVASQEARDTLVIEAQWRAARRWTQTIEETYQITLQELGSVNGYGVFPKEDSAGLEIPNDDAAWDQSLDTEQPSAPSGGGLRPFTAENCGGSALRPGESWAWTDKDDENRRQNFISTLIAVADVQMRASHRRNFVSWKSTILPELERTQFLSINAGGVQATGKVYQFEHVIDILQQTAKTNFKIAVSKVPAGGTQDPLDVPPRPDTTSGYVEPPSQTTLPSYYGGQDTALPYDETWEGFTGNLGIAIGSPDRTQLYPRRVKVTGADIEQTSRDAIQASQMTTLNILIEDQELVLT